MVSRKSGSRHVLVTAYHFEGNRRPSFQSLGRSQANATKYGGLGCWAICNLWLSLVGAKVPLPPTNADGNAQLKSPDISAAAPAPLATGYFDQKIDHFPSEPRYAPHDKGTFQQRYFWDKTDYQPGGPIFVFIPGEVPIDPYASGLSYTIIQHFAQQFHGLIIILESRYYGTSYPYNTSTTDHLAYLTTEQTIADYNAFAKNVKFPGLGSINPPNQPWILYGGSLAGALAAFTIKTYGSTFFAAIASSGVIHAQLDYPQWYSPIQLLASQDCVTSINNIVNNIDALVTAKQTSALQRLKEIFGLGALTDIRDFAQTIAFPIGVPFEYPTFTWQELYWIQGSSQDFFNFCDNVTIVDPPANNTQADYELANYTNNEPWTNLGNYAAYVKRVVLPLCTSGDYNSAACFGTQHPSYWANTSNGAVRSFLYTTCTEFGAYNAAFPAGQYSLISRVIDTYYTQQWCNWAFPKGTYNAIPSTPDLNRWNVYGGLNVSADRLLFIDGTADPWRDLCYHSTFAPEREWSELHPEYLINGAGHVWDFLSNPQLSTEPQFIRESHKFELRQVARWLKQFPSWKSGQM